MKKLIVAIMAVGLLSACSKNVENLNSPEKVKKTTLISISSISTYCPTAYELYSGFCELPPISDGVYISVTFNSATASNWHMNDLFMTLDDGNGGQHCICPSYAAASNVATYDVTTYVKADGCYEFIITGESECGNSFTYDDTKNNMGEACWDCF